MTPSNPAPSLAPAQRQDWLWLLGIVFLSCFYQLGAVPLVDLDEGAFTEATREMLASGDYISTWLNGEPRFDKPVLIHWLQAASFSVFGLTEWAARLPSALAGAATLMVLWWFMRRYASTDQALLAVAMVGLSLNMSLIFKAATADALLILFMVTSLLAIFHYTQQSTSSQQRRTLYLLYTCMGLGLLTKGPVAVFFSFLISMLFFSLQGRFKDWLQAIFFMRGWALMALIALPWYSLQTWKMGQAFIEGFFFKHNLSRFDSAMEDHQGSLFYYLPVILVAIWPFIRLLGPAFKQGQHRLRQPLVQYGLIWFGCVVVFFSVSGTKLPHYINYGLPGLMLVLALCFPKERATARVAGGHIQDRISAILPTALLLGLLWALPWLMTQAPVTHSVYTPILDNFMTLAGQHHWWVWMSVFSVLAGLVYGVPLATHKRLISAAGVFVLALSTLVLPTAGALQQSPIKQAALKAKQLNQPAVLWRFNRPSFSFYYQGITPKRAPKVGELALTHQDKLATFTDPYQIHYQKHGVVLLERQSGASTKTPQRPKPDQNQ